MRLSRSLNIPVPKSNPSKFTLSPYSTKVSYLLSFQIDPNKKPITADDNNSSEESDLDYLTPLQELHLKEMAEAAEKKRQKELRKKLKKEKSKKKRKKKRFSSSSGSGDDSSSDSDHHKKKKKCKKQKKVKKKKSKKESRHHSSSSSSD